MEWSRPTKQRKRHVNRKAAILGSLVVYDSGIVVEAELKRRNQPPWCGQSLAGWQGKDLRGTLKPSHWPGGAGVDSDSHLRAIFRQM